MNWALPRYIKRIATITFEANTLLGDHVAVRKTTENSNMVLSVDRYMVGALARHIPHASHVLMLIYIYIYIYIYMYVYIHMYSALSLHGVRHDSHACLHLLFGSNHFRSSAPRLGRQLQISQFHIVSECDRSLHSSVLSHSHYSMLALLYCTALSRYSFANLSGNRKLLELTCFCGAWALRVTHCQNSLTRYLRNSRRRSRQCWILASNVSASQRMGTLSILLEHIWNESRLVIPASASIVLESMKMDSYSKSGKMISQSLSSWPNQDWLSIGARHWRSLWHGGFREWSRLTIRSTGRTARTTQWLPARFEGATSWRCTSFSKILAETKHCGHWWSIRHAWLTGPQILMPLECDE